VPDATNTVKVDGVEPSILVRLSDEPEAPERVKLHTADDGTERFLVKGGEPVWVVGQDLVGLGAVPYEVVEIAQVQTSPAAAFSAPSPVVEPVKVNIPGQSGQ
jgi:hypothetical protein